LYAFPKICRLLSIFRYQLCSAIVFFIVHTELVSIWKLDWFYSDWGFELAYKSLQRNLNSAAQTILAVPMEVYERSGNEGPVRSVIRAVPIAVLKPMIGASEAVSKTLLGLHNTLDPNIRHDNEAKYK